MADYAKQLWGVLNNLRGSMEVTEYKNYLFPFIYYCYISKKISELMADELRNDEITYEEAWDAKDDEGNYEYREELANIQKDYYGVVIEPQYLAGEIAEYCRQNVGMYGYGIFIDEFRDAIDAFEENCTPSFRGTMAILNLDNHMLGDDPNEAGLLLAKLFMNSKNMAEALSDGDGDSLGDLYEQLMGFFASSAGKKGGEFFTPKEMSRLVAKLATHDIQNAKSISDPTCGSGSLLLQAAKEIESKGGRVGYLYGQELNNMTSKLARMNMAVHKVNTEDFEIACCNTLGDDIKAGELYDVTVANPPYSVEWDNGEYRYNDDRFAGYGALAPAKTADLAFVQHIVSHMSDTGRAAILLPHGVLFRGNAEQKIRKTLIETYNIIDAVIGLPANCFYGTGIAVCCLVLRKDRNGDSKNICFIDASKYFTKEGNKNRITDEDINRILDAYTNRKDIDHFCSIVDIDKIVENDFNLNIPIYVEAEKEVDEHDLGELFKEFEELENKENKLKQLINTQLGSFGVPYRFNVAEEELDGAEAEELGSSVVETTEVEAEAEAENVESSDLSGLM